MIRKKFMSVVAKYVAPSFLLTPSGITLYQSRPPATGSVAFAKGSAALAASVVLQLLVIRRCAMRGKPSNMQGLFVLVYPVLLLSSMALSFMLYNNIPPQMLLLFLSGGGGPRRLGAFGNQPIHQYRLSDVVDRVREIVGDRMNQGLYDVRER
ncbi:unnamed protein product [Sphacelaria rigidula]